MVFWARFAVVFARIVARLAFLRLFGVLGRFWRGSASVRLHGAIWKPRHGAEVCNDDDSYY